MSKHVFDVVSGDDWGAASHRAKRYVSFTSTAFDERSERRVRAYEIAPERFKVAEDWPTGKERSIDVNTPSLARPRRPAPPNT